MEDFRNGKINCLLVHPKFSKFSALNYVDVCKIVGAKYPTPPLGLLTVAALFPQNWYLKLIDINVEPLLEEHLIWADIVCTGGILSQQLGITSVIDQAHEHGKKVVVGGPDPTCQPQYYQTADYIVIGEGENTIPAFVDDLANGYVSGRYDSNEFVNIDLGEKASYGRGTITAKYQDTEAKGFFEIGISEEAVFELIEDTLTITNIGNTKYTKTVQITIGETTGSKYPKLNIGDSVSYKLIAPEGVYNIRVSDGKTFLSQGEVRLTGTGQVIGVLDESASQRSPVTGVGGRDIGEEDDITLFSYMKNSKFTYVFIFVIFGAMILLAVERMFKKKISK